MRTLILSSLLLLLAAGCGHRQQADPRLAGMATTSSPPPSQTMPVNVTRSIEPGAPAPTRGAPDGVGRGGR